LFGVLFSQLSDRSTASTPLFFLYQLEKFIYVKKKLVVSTIEKLEGYFYLINFEFLLFRTKYKSYFLQKE